MAYAQYFFANLNANSDVIRGTCTSMCPEDEVKLREKERLIHKLEIVDGRKKLVKSYYRSAADSTMVVPRFLRPYSVLKQTLDYLLLEVLKRTDVPSNVMYDFINDRLRAIRQDATIQRLPPEQCCNLLEPMVRFYVYYGYKLCELPMKDFDQVLNKKYLLECMKWYLSCCDEIHDNDISALFSGLNVNEKNKLQNDRYLVESLYLLCNLDSIHPMLRYLNLPRKFKRSKKISLAYNISVANLKGNFIRMCKLSEQLCQLTYCAFCLYLPVIQRRALQVLSHAYSSKALTVPLAVLHRWLLFESDEQARETCDHYGVETQRDAVRFSRTDFKHDAPLLPPKKRMRDEIHLSTINNIFTYKTSHDHE